MTQSNWRVVGEKFPLRAFEASPAAANYQWRSYTRMDAKIQGDGCAVRLRTDRFTTQWARIKHDGGLNKEGRHPHWQNSREKEGRVQK